MTAKRSKEIKEILDGLTSSQEELINKSLDKMETKGDVQLLPNVIDLWANTDDQAIKRRTESILFGLKHKEALQFLVSYLNSEISDEKKWLAANSIWQSGFDASEHLTELIDFAISNSYTAAIDIMTIIENSEFDETQEDTLDENIKRINTFAQQSKADVVPILMEINTILIDKKIAG